MEMEEAIKNFLSKSATPNESDEWRRQCRLEMHHACVNHVVDSINNFCDKDVHVLCADNKVKLGYPGVYIVVNGLSWVIPGASRSCPTCWCPNDKLASTQTRYKSVAHLTNNKDVFPLHLKISRQSSFSAALRAHCV